MEKRHEDYYRLISSETDDDPSTGSWKGREREEGEYGGRGIRGEKGRFSCCCSIPPPSFPDSVRPLISLHPSLAATATAG